MIGAPNLKVPIASALHDGSIIVATNVAGDYPLEAVDFTFVAVVASNLHALLHRPGTLGPKSKESVTREISWWGFLVIGPIGWADEVLRQDVGCGFVGGRVAPCVGVVAHARGSFVFERRAGFLRLREMNANGPILGGLFLSS